MSRYVGMAGAGLKTCQVSAQ
uniref:Uncharacterized protein n=1 Tax=Rhizophora mucronata TaxID=61149 RepID=A0A2P2IQ50_RHIMU